MPPPPIPAWVTDEDRAVMLAMHAEAEAKMLAFQAECEAECLTMRAALKARWKAEGLVEV